MRSIARKHNAFVKKRDSLGCLNPPHRRACIAGGPYVPWGWMTRWLWRRCPTRSHSELGRESLQRRWYFVLRHGRVGRCLVFQLHGSRLAGHLSGLACRYRYAGFGFDRGPCAPGRHEADTDFVDGIARVNCILAFPKLARGGAAR